MTSWSCVMSVTKPSTCSAWDRRSMRYQMENGSAQLVSLPLPGAAPGAGEWHSFPLSCHWCRFLAMLSQESQNSLKQRSLEITEIAKLTQCLWSNGRVVFLSSAHLCCTDPWHLINSFSVAVKTHTKHQPILYVLRTVLFTWATSWVPFSWDCSG